MIALQIAVGNREYGPEIDINSDGMVTALDALMILQAVSYHNLTEQASLKSHLRSGIKTHNPGGAS